MAMASAAGMCGLLGGAGEAMAEAQGARRYHLCLTPKAMEEAPDLLDIVRDAGVSDIWMAAFFYGHWYETPDRLREAAARVEAHGLQWRLINLPLGHPGDSLGDSLGETPLTPPSNWRMAVRPDGRLYSGTSLHPPGTEENAKAIRQLAPLKPDCIFLDDDFRLATGPGVIGGCFCDWHREIFLRTAGYGEGRWDELMARWPGWDLTP